ncbi:hypothetical protein BDZ89DRAFT_1045775 [Hymenopellis radicata]|nr:hypothetical protein BDZ89DRAFT_1045775 [Hymenopellis radicata]
MDVVRSYVRNLGPASPKKLSSSRLASLSRSLSTVVIPTTESALDVKKQFYDVVNTFFASISAGLSDEDSSTDLKARLVPMLPDMAKCFIAFHRLYVLKEGPFPVKEDDRMKLLFPFAHLSVHGSHVIQALAEPQAFMKCLAQLWALALTTKDSHFSLIQLSWTTIPQVALTDNGERTSAFAAFKDVLEEQPPRLFAQCCIRRLVDGMDDLDVRLIMLSTITICSRVSLELRRLFLASDGVRWALVPPHRLMTASGVPPTMEDIQTDFVTTFRFITQSVSIGRFWVAEAVRCGLLERLCNSQAFLDSPERTNATAAEGIPLASAVVGLMNVVNSHTVYRPVLKEAHLWIARLLRTNVEQRMDRNGAIWAAWEALKTTVRQRWLAKKRHIESCGNKSVTSSSAISNPNRDYIDAMAVVQLTTVGETAKRKAGNVTTNRFVRHGKWSVEMATLNPPPIVIGSSFKPSSKTIWNSRSTVHSPPVLRIDYVPVPRKMEITAVELLQDCEGWQKYEDWKTHSELRGKVYVRIPDGTTTLINAIAKVPEP